MFVRVVEQPAELWFHAEHIEIVAGDFVKPAFVSGTAAADAPVDKPIARDAAKGGIEPAIVEVVGIGLVIISLLLLDNVVQPRRLRNVDDVENQAREYAEDDNIRRNP